jgi:hypothetical protein
MAQILLFCFCHAYCFQFGLCSPNFLSLLNIPYIVLAPFLNRIGELCIRWFSQLYTSGSGSLDKYQDCNLKALERIEVKMGQWKLFVPESYSHFSTRHWMEMMIFITMRFFGRDFYCVLEHRCTNFFFIEV